MFNILYENDKVDYQFSTCKLQYLHGEWITTKTINNILKTAVNLNRFCVYPSDHEDVMIKVFNSCKSLISMGYVRDSYHGLKSASNGIEKRLSQTKQRKCAQMKIEIMSTFHDTERAEEIIIHIVSITHWLERPEIDDFMFIWI